MATIGSAENQERSEERAVLIGDLIDFVRAERLPISRQSLLVEISRLGTYAKAWARANHSQWEAALDAAIADGALIETNGKVCLAPVVKSGEDVQLELF